METITLKERFTPEERETHISFDPATKLWIMESNISRHFNKALRTGWTVMREYRYEDGLVAAMTLTAPERGITIKSPKKREISAEHKAKLLSSQIDDLECDSEDEN